MFRCSRALRFSLHLFQIRSVSSDALLHNLKNCSNEYQVFQLVSVHKSLLNVDHMSYAFNLLWDMQKEKTDVFLNVDEIQNHPEFIALQILAEHKVSCMDDCSLVDVLYCLLRLKVPAHSCLVQKLVVECWKRLETFDFSALSKFAVCLHRQELNSSPLMGLIANILAKNIHNIQDMGQLSILMVRLDKVLSSRLHGRLIAKVEFLMDSSNSLQDLQRTLRILFKSGFRHKRLLDKLEPILLQKLFEIDERDCNSLCNIVFLYQMRQVKQSDFLKMAYKKLLEFLDLCDSAEDFGFLFRILFPVVSQETRERLEDNLLTCAHKLNHSSLMNVMKIMAEARCRNPTLIDKICSMVVKNLDDYTPMEQCKITEALVSLPFQNDELSAKVQERLIHNLKTRFVTVEMVSLIHALSLTRVTHVNPGILLKLEDFIPQCNLSQMDMLCTSLRKWMNVKRSGSYEELHEKISDHAIMKLRKMENIYELFQGLKDARGTYLFYNVLLKEVLDAFLRFLPQVNINNVVFLSIYLNQSFTRCTPILDKIAAVAKEDFAKFQHYNLFRILRPFAYMNYEPPDGEEFFHTLIQQNLTNLDSAKCPGSVLLAYALSLLEYFPEELIKAILSIDFLIRLDSQLEASSPRFDKYTRRQLMELNRAVCIERPEYRVPWFHDRYCQQMLSEKNLEDQYVPRYILLRVLKVLAEALGGAQYTRMSVVTPYYYTIDFEFVLDKNKNPVSYMEQDATFTDVTKAESGNDTLVQEKKSLAPGTQKFAVNFLTKHSFCMDSTFVKGNVVMKKRHLEILGYYVIQIPHFEWDLINVRKNEAQVNYLRRKIFTDEP